MGKPEQEVVKKREGPRKSPISKFWIGTYMPLNWSRPLCTIALGLGCMRCRGVIQSCRACRR
jgi:hypothetical protein